MKKLADGMSGDMVYYAHMSKTPEYKNHKYNSIYTARNLYDLFLKINSLYNLYEDIDTYIILKDIENDFIKDEKEVNAESLMERLCDYHASSLEDGAYEWFTVFSEIK